MILNQYNPKAYFYTKNQLFRLIFDIFEICLNVNTLHKNELV
jgi:hypothetical protein